MGVAKDAYDVCLFNIEENVGNAGAEGSEPELDASISKESKWDEEHRTKSNRKRPPDHGGSGASPMKQSMPTTQTVDR